MTPGAATTATAAADAPSASAPAPTAAPMRRAMAAEVACALLAAIFMAVAFVPWRPPLTADQGLLDPSWEWAMGIAAARRVAFGRDVVFTYGPLGFLGTSSTIPAMLRWLVLGRVTLGIVFAAAVWALARPALRWPASGTLLAAAVAVLVAASPADVWLLGLPLLLVLLHFRRPAARRTLLAVTLAVAAAGLIKFTAMILGVGVVAVLTADELLRLRRAPRVAAAYLAGCAVLWLAAGQGPASFPHFVRTSAEVVRGYGPAMGLDLAPARVQGPVIAGWAVALLAVALGLERGEGPRRRAALFVTAFALVLFTAAKASFVRGDHTHAAIAHPFLLLATLFYVTVAWPAPTTTTTTTPTTATATAVGSISPTTRRRVCACMLIFSMALAQCSVAMLDLGGLPPLLWPAFQSLPDRLATLAAAVLGGPSSHARFDRDAAEVRREVPLPPLTGTVDVYPTDAIVAIAHGLDYGPRPVPQSYSAYTPLLAELNADVLRHAGRAPQTILFRLDAFDDRFPATDDGPSWPELLARYDLAGEARPYLILRRAAAERPPAMEPLLTTTRGVAGRELSIPDVGDDLVYARLTIEPTFRGRLANLAYRPAVPSLVVRLADGTSHPFRLVPGAAAAGFILSPLLENTADVASLFRTRRAGRSPDRHVVGISVGFPDDDARAQYHGDFALSLWRLKAPQPHP